MAKKRRKAKKSPRRRRSATTSVAPVRRRRRRANPSRRRRAVRRVSKGVGTGLTAVTNELMKSLPRLLGKITAGWAVRRWSSTAGGIFGQAHTSPTAGEGWSLPQYAIALGVAWFGPRVLGKFIPANEFRRGVVDLMMEKFVYTEIIARNSWAQQQFGTGDVGYNAATGQSYVDQGGRWNAMQGIVTQSPLDGIVEASPLDGGISHGYGHLLPAGASLATTKSGKYQGSGYKSGYHAAYTH